MADVLIVAYLLIVVALVVVILLQRSEGGGLGMGGGGSGGFMSVRGTANMLTRATGILATLFFAIALGLTLLSGADKTTTNILDNAAKPTGPAPATTTAPGNKPAAQPTLLDQLNAAQAQQSGTATPAAPASTPATTPSAPPAAPSGGQDAPDVALPTPAPAAPADSTTTTAPTAGGASAPASPAPATN